MAPRSTHILLLLLVLVLVAVAESSAGSGHTRFHERQRTCGGRGGLVGDCINGSEEMGMESESVRRSLWQRPGASYISYDALKRDRVPCGKRGRSYYNCGAPGDSVNPYRRQCTAITRCARYLH